MKIRTDNRYAYAAILLTVCLVVAKIMGWFPISWFVALLPVLFPFLLIGAFALVLILVTVGLIAMYSASYPYAYANRGGDSFFYVKRQLVYCGLGIFVMLVVSA